MKTTAEQFKRLLPTLQHLARFPHCNRAKICERDAVAQSEVDAALVDLTDGAPSIWDEDCIAELAKGFGVKVPAYDPEARPHVAPPAARVAAPSAEPGRGKRASTRRVEVAPAPAAAGNRDERAAAKFRAMCLALLADDGRSENRIRIACGLATSSWHYFKKTRFGPGRPSLAQLRAFVEGKAAAATPVKAEPAATERVKRKYTRRGLSPKPPAAPGAPAVAPHTGELQRSDVGRGAGLVMAARDVAPGTALGAGLLAELLTAQLTGAQATHALGDFRLELNLRLVPITAR